VSFNKGAVKLEAGQFGNVQLRRNQRLAINLVEAYNPILTIAERDILHFSTWCVELLFMEIENFCQF
jgi:hypothetical protein